MLLEESSFQINTLVRSGYERHAPLFSDAFTHKSIKEGKWDEPVECIKGPGYILIKYTSCGEGTDDERPLFL